MIAVASVIAEFDSPRAMQNRTSSSRRVSGASRSGARAARGRAADVLLDQPAGDRWRQ
jgi:hypothetical protein